jgi:hypothetical protein
MNCFCNKELIHSGNHTFEECGLDGKGIVSNLTCCNNECNVETVVVYINLDEKEND